MKHLLLSIVAFNCLVSKAQTSIEEITDKNISDRVKLIKHRTDSFLLKAVSKNLFNKFTYAFGVTYLDGEFYNNYIFLNNTAEDPENIYNVTQYYSINDRKLGLSDTIGVIYLELKNKFDPGANKLEVRFKSIDDCLKIKAVHYLYDPATQLKLGKLIELKKLKAPIVKISADGKTNTYFLFVREREGGHNYGL